MEQLRFTAVHEDGQHLVLTSADDSEVLLPIDERLRSALRTRGAVADAPATPLRPRDVQAMIRAGQSPEEVAEITGWPAERVERFEAPIVAEREHIAGMARAAHVRGRGPDGAISTLETRVHERLAARGVDTDNTGWDATRPEGGSWTVIVTFVAGQRQRAAAWRFDPLDRTVEALDDEARWLSEDEQALPGSAAGKELFGGAAAPSEEGDLMTTMRERSRSRSRRKKPSTANADPAGLPSLADAPEQVLPLEELAYDPDSMGLPPAAHGRPADADDDARSTDGRSKDSDDTTAAVPEDDDVDPADGTSSYNVTLELDDDYEVDPSPQAATLAELFGDDRDYSEDYSEDDSDVDDEDEAQDHDEAGDSDDRDSVADDDLELAPVAKADAESKTESKTEPDATSETEPDGKAAELEATPDAEPDTTEPSTTPSDETTRPEKPKRRKDGRPGVPSWDDIMFGAKDQGR